MSLETQLSTALTSHSLLVLGFAFLGGVVSSFLPCTIAMLPVLVGYMGGYSEAGKLEIVRQVLLFILGIALVMTILGVAASLVGLTFGELTGSGFYYAIGILAIVMGLQLLDIIHLPLPQFVRRLPESKPGRILAPILLGLAFGMASSPCGTPFLAAILGFISRERNIALGAASLFCYALGQGTLLLIAGLSTGLLKHMAVLRHVGAVMNKLSAFLFFVFGALMIAMGAGVYYDLLRLLHLLPPA